MLCFDYVTVLYLYIYPGCQIEVKQDENTPAQLSVGWFLFWGYTQDQDEREKQKTNSSEIWQFVVTLKNSIKGLWFKHWKSFKKSFPRAPFWLRYDECDNNKPFFLHYIQIFKNVSLFYVFTISLCKFSGIWALTPECEPTDLTKALKCF